MLTKDPSWEIREIKKKSGDANFCYVVSKFVAEEIWFDVVRDPRLRLQWYDIVF